MNVNLVYSEILGKYQSIDITFINTYRVISSKNIIMNYSKKTKVKFHGTEVANIIILYAIRPKANPITEIIEEFDALKVSETCEMINVQVVADFVTITLYKQETTNSILRRELIPLHAIEHIWVNDSPESVPDFVT
ncbi:MAG TPA: hypothetical protein VI278_08480 [Nitrososphaeraceae archaeon]